MRKLWLVLFVLLAACGETTELPETIPADFSITYEHADGSVPPPHHTEHTITINADRTATIEYWPSYPSNNTPSWTEAFTLTTGQHDALYERVKNHSIFTNNWKIDSDPPIGGGLDSLKATANGKTVTIPSDIVDTGLLSSFYDFVDTLVPQEIWDKLKQQKAEFDATQGN